MAPAIGTPCARDASCSGAGLICNESWGICVVSSCDTQPDFTPCEFVTSPDRSYDICSSRACVSPGCGDASCNPPGPGFALPDTSQQLCYGIGYLAIDPDAFPASDLYVVWSSSSYARDTARAWYVAFAVGWAVYTESKTDEESVRCVRRPVGVRDGGPRFTRTVPVADQPVVGDAVTGLVWQGCTAGQTGANCSGSSPGYGWIGALLYCQLSDWGGFTDWYLPNIRELQSIVDDRRAEPAIDTVAFPGDPSEEWSSSVNTTDCPYSPCTCVWGVLFTDGSAFDSRGYAVRCARQGP
ncbi:MAG: DUF1566 domain-containing protein [Deltaproteobacteria bacterium]|nr:DUF1566 domain-containing protein [Deltaproteobacteria bacterium]